jgi:uncharacterized protein YdcH (DUF465 family)
MTLTQHLPGIFPVASASGVFRREDLGARSLYFFAPKANALACEGRGVLISAEGGHYMFEGQPQSEIDAMLEADPEFKQLYQRHRELDKKITDAELGVLAIDDATLGQLKREKLHAKEKLLRLYDARTH